MKNYFKYLSLFVFITSIIVLSCNTNDESSTSDNFSQEQKDYVTKTVDIFKMADFFAEKNKWILTDVNFLRAENDPEVEIRKNEIDGLLTFDYYNSENKELLRTGYFKFKKNTDSESYKLISGGGESCSGVNCSKCKLKNPWMQDSYCKCERVGHPDAGPSYCNHSTGRVANVKDLTTSKKEINNLILENPEFLIQEVKQKLKK